MEEEPCPWSEIFEGEVVKADEIDRHAYWYSQGNCVVCHKGPQEVAGNDHMGTTLTHCYPCYLKLSEDARQERTKGWKPK